MSHDSAPQTAAPGWRRSRESDANAAERPTQVDLLSSAVVLCIAATAWFLWGRTDGIAPTALLVAAGLSLVTLVLVIMRLRGAQGPSTMAVDPQARRMYWIGTAGEIVAIPMAAVVLTRSGMPEIVPAAVLAIVALHFIPLAIAFKLADLWWVIAACLAVSVAAVGVYLAGYDVARALAGGLGGLVLLAAAGAFIVRAR